MARRTKPRWDWEPTHDAKDMYQRIARLDFEWLEEQIGSGLTPEIPTTEQSLLTILWTFYDAEFNDPVPNFDEVRAALGEISECAATLGEKLDSLDWKSGNWLGGAFQELADSSECRFTEPQIAESAELFLNLSCKSPTRPILTAIKVLIDAIDNLDIPSEQKARGPRPKTSIKNLIYQVDLLIKEQSGRDPLDGFYYDPIEERYQGRFVRLLEHIFDRFAPDLNMTNAAIGGQIRRTVGNLSR